MSAVPEPLTHALELFVIGAVCVWCAGYGISLVARFGVALWVFFLRSACMRRWPA